MDEDGSTGEARTRLARGTTPSALQGNRDDGAAEATAAAGGLRDAAGGVVQNTGPGVARGTGACVAQAVAVAVDEPAHSIHEAVERLIGARDADEAIAEWMTGGG
jgi:hypothetical protein